jgi:hypothetical protein
MRVPVMVAAAVAVAGAVFVVAYEPSSADSRVHDWLAVTFVAATSGLFFAGGTASRRRIVLVGLAYALFVATTLAWFVESAVLWVALAGAVAATALLVRRWSRPV